MKDITYLLTEFRDLKKSYSADIEILCSTLDSSPNDSPSDNVQALTSEEHVLLRDAIVRIKRHNELKKKLPKKLKGLDPIVISDPALQHFARKMREEAIEDDLKYGGQGDLGLFDEFINAFHPEECASNLADLTPLILTFSPPPHLMGLVREAVLAYCANLPTAVVALSRSLLEAAVVDIAIKIGRVRDPDKISAMRMCERISSLIDKSVTKQSPLRQGIDRFMGSASRIVHGDEIAGYGDAKDHLEQAFILVQQLYNYYKAQYPQNIEKA